MSIHIRRLVFSDKKTAAGSARCRWRVLFVPMLLLHAFFVVEDGFAQAQVFGGDLEELVVRHELEAVFDKHRKGCYNSPAL